MILNFFAVCFFVFDLLRILNLHKASHIQGHCFTIALLALVFVASLFSIIPDKKGTIKLFNDGISIYTVFGGEKFILWSQISDITFLDMGFVTRIEIMGREEFSQSLKRLAFTSYFYHDASPSQIFQELTNCRARHVNNTLPD
jgi:hypothetical protein